MSLTALKMAFRIIENTPDLLPSATITLLVLAECHNQETGRCDPAVATIAAKGSISARAVQKGLRQLVNLKMISITYRQAATGRGKRNRTSRYRILGGAQSAPALVNNLRRNLEYTAPSAFDDLAMLIEGGTEDA